MRVQTRIWKIQIFFDDEEIANFHKEKDERKFMSKDWKWESWEEVGDDKEIQVPPENDNYNVPHGLKPGVENRFNTFLQCIFECTVMNPFSKYLILITISTYEETFQ